MAEVSVGWEQNVCNSAQEDRLVLRNLVCGEGVANVLNGDLLVTTTNANNHSVSVAQGGAIIQGDQINDQGEYSVYNDSPEVVGPLAAGSAQPRVDAVLAHVYDSQYGDLRDGWELEVQQGTATAGATLGNLTGAPGQAGGPAVVNNAIVLAYVLVATTDTATTNISSANILDARGAYSPCGAPYVELKASSTSSIPHNSFTRMALTNTVHWDKQTFFVGSGGSHSVVTILKTGLYNLSCHGFIGGGASATRLFGFALNGTNNYFDQAQAATVDYGADPVSMYKFLNVGDQIEMVCYQFSGSTLITDALGRLVVVKVG